MALRLNGDFAKLKKYIDESLEYEDKVLFFQYENQNGIPTFNIELIKSYINEIKKMSPNQNFDYHFAYITDDNHIVDSDACKILETVDNYLRDNLSTELYISTKKEAFDGFGFRKTLSANRKLDSVANNIKNANNDGIALSNFEKFMLAYDYVTELAYNEGEDIYHKETSHWVPVLEGDKIVCSGYASLLAALCNRIFPENEVKVLQQSLNVYYKSTNEFRGGHSNNVIFIKDEKYNINGLFYVDACWDSIDDDRKDKPQSYCCIPLADILSNKIDQFEFSDGFTHFYLLQHEEYKNMLDKIEKSSFPKITSGIRDESLEGRIEAFFQGVNKHNPAQQYFSKQIAKIINYETSPFFEEDKITLEQFKEDIQKIITNNYLPLLQKYPNVQVPGFIPYKVYDLYNIDTNFDKIKNNYQNLSMAEKAIENIAKAFTDHKVIEYRKKLEKTETFKSKSFENYIINTITKSLINEMEEKFKKKKKEFVKKARQDNTIAVMKNINEKANAEAIPLQAFINAYRIIGKEKGLNEKELEEYVQNRLIRSIERTQLTFDVSQCRNCFATTKIENVLKEDTHR